MEQCPNSTETELQILAFAASASEQIAIFIGVLLVYMISVIGNIMITVIICIVPNLQTPMYLLLCNLSITDIIYVSNTFPKLLSILITQDKRMTLSACITQVYFFSGCVACDIFVLTCMSYDRYVAVCKPLHYPLIMSRRICIKMSAFSWIVSSLNALKYALLTSMLSFCSSHKIDHFFCDLKTLYSITTSDTASREVLFIFENIFVAFLPFVLTITSYIYIISSILKICSIDGRFKAFSSCTSLLTTVILFYAPIIFLYAMPDSEHHKEQDKLLSLLYMGVVPMLNPFVYALRNKEILAIIRKIMIIRKSQFFVNYN